MLADVGFPDIIRDNRDRSNIGRDGKQKIACFSSRTRRLPKLGLG